jgi:hypothetical protein
MGRLWRALIMSKYRSPCCSIPRTWPMYGIVWGISGGSRAWFSDFDEERKIRGSAGMRKTRKSKRGKRERYEY